MTNQELAAVLRKCGRVEGPGDCVACRFYKGDDPALCIPAMTAACADALENTTTHVAALQQEIERLRGQLERQWISVEERVPEVGEDVLTLSATGAARVMHLNKSGYDWSVEVSRWHGFLMPRDSVTHWMPLPEPPKEATKDGSEA